MKHTASGKLCLYIENAYASGYGAAAAKYDETAIPATGATSLVSMNYLIEDSNRPPLAYMLEEFQAMGDSPDAFHSNKIGFEYEEFVLTQYLQDTYWMQKAVASLTAGGIHESYLIHYEDADGQYDIFGCVLVGYEIKATGGQYPSETLTFAYYSVASGNIVDVCPAWKSTTTKVNADLEFQIDGTAVPYRNISFLIEMDWKDNMRGDSYFRMEPDIIMRKTTVQFVYEEDTASINADREGTSVTLRTLKFLVGANYIQVTNLAKKSGNEGDMPMFGEMPYDSTYISAGSCVYSYA